MKLETCEIMKTVERRETASERRNRNELMLNAEKVTADENRHNAPGGLRRDV
jgi:hypothetical protein